MHSMQTACAQKMSQGGAQTVSEFAAAATAATEHGGADDRQKRRPTAWFIFVWPNDSSRGWDYGVANNRGAFARS